MERIVALNLKLGTVFTHAVVTEDSSLKSESESEKQVLGFVARCAKLSFLLGKAQ